MIILTGRLKIHPAIFRKEMGEGGKGGNYTHTLVLFGRSIEGGFENVCLRPNFPIKYTNLKNDEAALLSLVTQLS